MKCLSKSSQKGKEKLICDVPYPSNKHNGSLKRNKSQEDSEHNGSLKRNKSQEDSEFPIKPFKGTKYSLKKYEEKSKMAHSDRKRKADADFDNEVHVKTSKNSKLDPLTVLSKLEKFSDIWNDCPNVENTKTKFEIQISSDKNKTQLFSKERSEMYIGHRKKLPKGNETNKSSVPNVKERITNFRETNHHHEIRDGKKSITLENEGYKNIVHKDVIFEGDTNKSGKYDSKLAELKRKKAVEEQSQLHADQKNIIKKALSSMDVKQQVNKKIVFSDAEDNEETQTKVVSEENKSKNQKLFNDDDSSESDFELKINSQFEGKKGQKLLKLQTKFAVDSRFSLDSRFYESESEGEEKEALSENIDFNNEKKRQLEILESIVKQPIQSFSARKKIYEEPWKEMVRFDPTREDHQKYILKPQDIKKEEKVKEKKKALPNLQESKPEVSSEKVYTVKENLKEVLHKENKTEFSLLKLFGPKEEDSNIQQDSSESIKNLKYATKNPFKYDSSESEEEEEEKKAVEKERSNNGKRPPLPSWKTTFFFSDNDSRLKEAEEFLKAPEEIKDDQEFAEKRKMLKDFIRHKFKNSNRKKDPFKKKLGGVKKKVFHKKKGK